MTLAAAGVEFEDNRITFEDWGALKPNVPFNGLPMFEVDGKQLGQSGAILRFIGRECGMAGGSSYDAGLIDSIAETVTDVREKPIPFFFEKDEEKKKEGLTKFFKEQLPDLLGKLEKIAAGNGFFVGEKVSYADTHLFALLNGFSLMQMPEGLERPGMDSYPKLQSIMQKVGSMAGVKKYLESRPETPF